MIDAPTLNAILNHCSNDLLIDLCSSLASLYAIYEMCHGINISFHEVFIEMPHRINNSLYQKSCVNTLT